MFCFALVLDFSQFLQDRNIFQHVIITREIVGFLFYMLEKSLEADAALSNPCFSVTAKAVNSPEVCCFEFFDKRIPKVNIVSINKTHSQCSTPAFV